MSMPKQLTSCASTFISNITNGTEVDSAIDQQHVQHILAPLDKLVSGTLVFFTILPFVLFHFRFFPIGTTSSLLLGTVLMVFTRVLSQEEVYEVIGRKENLTVIFMLLGLMLLVQYFEREQLLTSILRHFLKAHLTFENYIWRVALLSFFLSALLTSDACSLLLSPCLLKLWEVQERQQVELETIVLAIATSANIGSATTIFGSAHMVLLASRTSLPQFHSSVLNLRNSLLYLGPPALLAFFLNLGFLIGHYRFRSRYIQTSKLISEASTSEMGLTRAYGSGNLTKLKNESLTHTNGILRYNGGDEISFENDTDSLQEDRISGPCQLETIPEDEVLEITSSRSATSMVESDAMSPEHTFKCHVSGEDHLSSSDSSEDEEEGRNTTHAPSSSDTMNQERNSLTLDSDYRPNALQAEDLSARNCAATTTSHGVVTPTKSLERHGLRLSQRGGIYRSVSAISAVQFIHTEIHEEDSNRIRQGFDGNFSSSDSISFQIFLFLMLFVIIALNLSSSGQVSFDIGLVPVGAVILIVTADVIMNRQSAVVAMKRCDWSVVLMFMATFILLHGLNKTGLPRWVWYHIGLQNVSGSLQFMTISTLAGISLVASNTLTPYIFLLTILDLLQPCQKQLPFVLYVAWCSSLGGNLTLFGSVSNVIVAQKARQVLDFRLSYWLHLRFAFITTLVNIFAGLCLILGLLQISANV